MAGMAATLKIYFSLLLHLRNLFFTSPEPKGHTKPESDIDDTQQNTVDFDADADYVPDVDVSNQIFEWNFRNIYDHKQHELRI